MNLRTTYLGLDLPHPLMVGASPFVDDLDLVRRAEDAGAAAIVMHSLFEEELRAEDRVVERLRSHYDANAEAATFLPERMEQVLGPDAYLERVRRTKAAVKIPVVGSLNGVTDGGWLHFAHLIEEAGADALELNVYAVGHDPARSAEDVERETVEMVRHVCRETRLPVAVKLSPFYTALAHFADRLEQAGAKGLVLFNRFYQPDIDPERLELTMELHLSDSWELLLRLRWLAILSGRTRMSLAATGGVHRGLDALKAVMAGADGVQMVSSLLRRGPEHLATVRAELVRWLEEHEYDSLAQAQGSMNLRHCPDPAQWERGNYVRMLQAYNSRPMV
jgi:dihydroorotate dehydrogenase (fumarate)